MNAAKYFICAEQQEIGEEMRKALTETYDLSEKNLQTISANLQLETSSLSSCLSSSQTTASITEDQEKGRSLGVTGTPTFFINGKKYEGGYPIENMEKFLRENTR